jgi:hypothetical protein
VQEVTHDLTDWAVYAVPPLESALYQTCAATLGWDCRRESTVERLQLPGIAPEVLKTWVGPAAVYGPHATLCGAMRIPREHHDHVVADLQEVARRFAPIQLERGRFAGAHDFWYAGSAPRPILVVQFDEPSGELRALHAETLVRFNTLAVSSLFTTQPNYPPRFNARVVRYHDPRVLEDFEFHVSFATALPSSDAADRLRRSIVDSTGLFSEPEHARWTIDELWLFERRPDGFWRLAQSFPLSR